MNQIADKIRENGGRFTKQRGYILNTLTDHPLSVSEVAKSLKSKGIGVDKATLYRTLDCFTTLGLVGKTQFREREVMYELINEKGHHHHLICDACGIIEDIPLNERPLIKTITKQSKFLVKSHSLEFYGVCINCQ